MLRRWLYINVLWLLVACAPEYNWRTVQMAEGAVEQLFPASPHEERVAMGGQADNLHYFVASAKVGDAVFIATWIPLLPDQSDQQLYDTVVAGLLQRAGQSLKPLPAVGEVFTLQSTGRQQQNVRTDVRVLRYAAGVLQLSVSAEDKASFPDDAATQFLAFHSN
ncbi:MAG TPA: hypothetical protein VK026_06935 [Paenalcaligenes sp.]|nr:hypothetical protein [Paenalcaligenes sp.]